MSKEKWVTPRLTRDDGVSVVIPHYGDPAPTRRLVASLMAYPPLGGVQVIVSDDASPVAYGDRPADKVIRSEVNGGFGTAVNRGVVHATQPWLLIMNSDITIEPGFVQQFLDAASVWQPAVCGVRLRTGGEAGFTVAARRHHTGLALSIRHVGVLDRYRESSWWRKAARGVRVEDESTGPVDFVVGAVLLLPRPMFESEGGFDERFFMYSEEADLQRRLQQDGVKSVLLADLAVEHASGGSSSEIDVQLELLRSHYLYLQKWGGPLARERFAALLATGIAVDWSADMFRWLTNKDIRPGDSARQRWKGMRSAYAAGASVGTRRGRWNNQRK